MMIARKEKERKKNTTRNRACSQRCRFWDCPTKMNKKIKMITKISNVFEKERIPQQTMSL